jgi:prolyl oligopeptidase PreP (S9A serine peptidase family)
MSDANASMSAEGNSGGAGPESAPGTAARAAGDPEPGYPEPGYPEAERCELVEEIHGQLIADPYRWLEDPGDPRAQEWCQQQDRLFAHWQAGWLSGAQGQARERLRHRLAALAGAGTVSAPVWRGARQFFTRRRAGPGPRDPGHGRPGPDAYAAALCSAPALDMVRSELFGIGALTVVEYGSPRDPEEFPWLLAQSPYHHVRPGTAYPAVLLAASEADARVNPLHARKFAAALQHATSAPAARWPVLLRREHEVGHTNRAVSRSIPLWLDQLSFFAGQLGAGWDGPGFRVP